VKLWYSKVDYKLRLGILASIWTPHISNADSSSLTLHDAALVTSIFPERDNSCYFMVQENSDEGVLCKTPLGYRDGKQLDGLITLKNYVEGGHDVEGGKVLVAVKSIGGRKNCQTSYSTSLARLMLMPRSQSQQKKAPKPPSSPSTSSMIPSPQHSPSGAASAPPPPTGKPLTPSSSLQTPASEAIDDLRWV